MWNGIIEDEADNRAKEYTKEIRQYELWSTVMRIHLKSLRERRVVNPFRNRIESLTKEENKSDRAVAPLRNFGSIAIARSRKCRLRTIHPTKSHDAALHGLPCGCSIPSDSFARTREPRYDARYS
jgi:hypothetical protein